MSEYIYLLTIKKNPSKTDMFTKVGILFLK